jgi:hypothetical protein
MQDMYGRTLICTANADGTVTYTAQNPDGSDTGLYVGPVEAHKPLDAVCSTFNAMAPDWWIAAQQT